MTDKILLKRSLTSGSIPTTASLEPGELAINVHDATVFLKQSGSAQEVIRPLLTLNTDSTGDILLTGSITSTDDITAPNFNGDLLGTASFAITASYAETTAAGQGFPFEGDAEITGSLTVSGSFVDFTETTGISGSVFTGSFIGDGSGLTGLVTTLNITGSDGTIQLDLKEDDLTVTGSNGVNVAVTTNTLTISIPEGTVSSSAQVDVTQTTNISTIATTGSNTFTGIQTITDDTESTSTTTGALIVSGGVGIGKNLNVGGDVNITGLLTVVSQSTLYVTSSTLDIGTNKIVVNVDAINRFGGISVFDSGSANHSGSLFWDSQNDRWIYETESGSTYDSAVILAGPQYTGTLGDESGLTVGTVPVAQTSHNLQDSPITVSGSDVEISNNLEVIGSVSASAFGGDGSALTGIVTNLNVTGSDGGSGSINLKDDGLIVSGVNGINVTVSTDTLTISGSDITLNGGTVGLGGTLDLTLEDITTAGATTDTQVTLNGGAVISGVLYSSGSASNIVGPTTDEIIATVSTGSYDAAHFDYIIKDGTNYRTGIVMAVWDGTSIVHTDNSTTDIGDTSTAIFDVDLDSGNARLKFGVDTGTWTVKTSIRAL